jgi:glucose-1-phosphate cytidylyltransferase
MKAVILAGGIGSRLSEETALRPKPMVEVGGKPILWHIMKTYAAYGIQDFVICLGYKGYAIKEYFANYVLHMSDVTIDLEHNTVELHDSRAENWHVTLVDTGEETMTGGRIKRIQPHVDGESFLLTYGDGVADIDIAALIAYHERTGTLATLTAVRPQGRFGALDLDADSMVTSFSEKPPGDGGYINGGYFVLEPGIFDYIEGDATLWERGPLEHLAADHQLSADVHDGYWQPMDTLRAKNVLETLWSEGPAPWKVWE